MVKQNCRRYYHAGYFTIGKTDDDDDEEEEREQQNHIKCMILDNSEVYC